MKKSILFIALCVVFICMFSSCKEKNRFEINNNVNRVEVDIKRFDKDLILLDTTNISASIHELRNRYPVFFEEYVSQILDVNPDDSIALYDLIPSFLSDSVFNEVNKKSLEVFDNVSDIEKSLSTAYTYILHYFPEIKLPEIYFFVSGFNRSVMLGHNFIALGTDLYLGADYAIYKSFTYQYLIYNMRRESVASDLVSAILFHSFPMNSNNDRLLDNMIYRGRVMYLLSVFMPDEKPENLIGYTPDQLKWSEKHEKQIWGAIIDQKHLFSTDLMLIRKYMNDAPFTAPISQDSPGRLGTWIGWQIVKSYMKRNEKATLQDLMKETSYQKILEESGY